MKKSSLNMIKNNSSTPFKMRHQSPLNERVVSSSGGDDDIDVQQIEAVDLGSISNAEAKKNLNTKFKAAKDKWVEGYGGPNNDSYKEEKGGVFYDPVKDRIRTSYLEYPEDADHIGNDEFLGKNWDNNPLKAKSPLNNDEDKRVKFKTTNEKESTETKRGDY